jgi:hypothetical protein
MRDVDKKKNTRELRMGFIFVFLQLKLKFKGILVEWEEGVEREYYKNPNATSLILS